MIVLTLRVHFRLRPCLRVVAGGRQQIHVEPVGLLVGARSRDVGAA
jgi:hypothetical protein